MSVFEHGSSQTVLHTRRLCVFSYICVGRGTLFCTVVRFFLRLYVFPYTFSYAVVSCGTLFRTVVRFFVHFTEKKKRTTSATIRTIEKTIQLYIYIYILLGCLFSIITITINNFSATAATTTYFASFIIYYCNQMALYHNF